MEIDGYRAVIQYDPEIDLLRGEFIDLNGGADFYAADLINLRKEGRQSLKVFMDMCREDKVEPRKQYSGEIDVQLPPKLHAEIAALAGVQGKSIDAWVTDVIGRTMIESR
ncbi:MAG TPA: type II toxin-antitoxin system HicB family antitoxin [Lamprocystis sp. (in: g-proteobacteria)]|nr:type II toxin-antitoxin system HicB family antitoxin [Lamprocystis sp. (in: g-proteobacteria)]